MRGMYGLPKDLDLSFFIGKTLNSVAFAVNVIHLNFDDGVSINLESSFQHLHELDVANRQLGTIQSVYLIQLSSLMQLAGKAVVAAAGKEDGKLKLTFDNGHVLYCRDDTEGYECYNFTDGQRLWIV